MNRREAIVAGACALLLKPLTVLAAWFKKDEPKALARTEFVPGVQADEVISKVIQRERKHCERMAVELTENYWNPSSQTTGEGSTVEQERRLAEAEEVGMLESYFWGPPQETPSAPHGLEYYLGNRTTTGEGATVMEFKT